MTDICYRAAPPSALCAETLGELTVVFDRRSAQTHLMAPPLPEILAVMGEQSWEVATLAARLADDFDLAEADPLSIITQRLAELESLGLAQRT